VSSVDPDRALPNFRPLILSLFVNVGLSAIAIQVLTHLGVALLYAIVASSVFPLAELVISQRRRGRADVISVLTLVLLAISAFVAILGNDPRYALVRDSALTSLAGVFFLATLLRPKPIMYELSLEMQPGATAALWDERWRTRPLFRRAMRVMTAVWGCGLILDSVVRVVAALVLSPAVTVAVSPFVAVAVFGGLIWFTLTYIRYVRRLADAKTKSPG
jgi:hypothetical protein